MLNKFENLLEKEVLKYREKEEDSDYLYAKFKQYEQMYGFPFLLNIMGNKFRSSELRLEIIKIFIERNDNRLIYLCLGELQGSIKLSFFSKYELFQFYYLIKFGLKDVLNILFSNEFINNTLKNILEREDWYIGFINNFYMVANIIEKQVDKEEWVLKLKNIVTDKSINKETRLFYLNLYYYFDKEAVIKIICNLYREMDKPEQYLFLFLKENIDKEFISLYYDIIENHLLYIQKLDSGNIFLDGMTLIINKFDNSKLEGIITKHLENNTDLEYEIKALIYYIALKNKYIMFEQYYEIMQKEFKYYLSLMPDKKIAQRISIIEAMNSRYFTDYSISTEDKEKYLEYLYKVLEEKSNCDILNELEQIILKSSIFYSKYMEDISNATTCKQRR